MSVVQPNRIAGADGDFRFSPASFVHFRDTAALERVRAISRADITRHPNPDFRIRVMPDSEIEFVWLEDMFFRIKSASEREEKLVMVLPNPYPGFARLARLINRFRVSCRRVHFFAMDEFANENDEVAPESWPQSLVGAMRRYLWNEIDAGLRPPESHFHGPTTQTIKGDYGKILEDHGNADIIYTGPGWTGHLCFVEPDAPEFAAASLDEWKQMGSRVNTLSPFSIAQQALHGAFGMSGDLAAVPPKGATIGPAQVIAARHRIDMHALTVHGTATSWQRLMSRLALHGPVTPQVPSSILQTLRTDVWMTETAAADIEPDWRKGY
jgi:glucosamine-6-phosphate deaminase